MIRALGLSAAMLAALSAAAADTPVVRLYSAGSLRAAMTDIGKAYTEAYGVTLDPTFGGSGLLKGGKPRPAYNSVQKVISQLRGYHLERRVNAKGGWVVIFARDDGARKVAFWSGAGSKSVVLRGNSKKKITLQLGASPGYKDLPSGF